MAHDPTALLSVVLAAVGILLTVAIPRAVLGHDFDLYADSR